MSKRLAAIDCDAPCHVDVGDAKWEGPDVEKAREFFNSMEFQSLLRRLDRFEQQDAQASVSGGMSDTYELIDTEQRLRDLAERIGQSGYMSVYAGPGGITTGVHTHVIREFSWPRLLGISAGDRPYLIDFRSGDLACSDAYQDLMWKYLGPVLQDPEVKKFGFDLKWLYTLGFHRGIFLKGLGFDAMVGAYLLDPTRTALQLDALVNGYLGGDMPQSIDDLPKDLRLGDDAARAHMAHLAQGRTLP